MDSQKMTKELQKVEMEMLSVFIEICRKHHLKYFLIGGSCLGAIRHQGFIPWDDDIDLGMPRKDYEKFCEIAPKELGSSYFFQNFDTEPNCGLVFGKIRKNGTILSETYSYHIDMNQGVWIDIFPYDYVYENRFHRNLHFYCYLLIKNMYIIRCGYKNPRPQNKLFSILYNVAKILSQILPLSVYIKLLKRMMICCKDSKLVFPFGGAYPKKDVIPKDWINNLYEVNFEEELCCVFSKSDNYLKQLYNNYMQLPPVEKRKGGMHNIYEVKL